MDKLDTFNYYYQLGYVCGMAHITEDKTFINPYSPGVSEYSDWAHGFEQGKYDALHDDFAMAAVALEKDILNYNANIIKSFSKENK